MVDPQAPKPKKWIQLESKHDKRCINIKFKKIQQNKKSFEKICLPDQQNNPIMFGQFLKPND
jgi:hypothetical protein